MIQALHFEAARVIELPLTKGTSGIAVIPSGLLLVHDDEGIIRVRGQRSRTWASRSLHPSLGDLEAIATDERHTVVWALSEVEGTVIELPLTTRPHQVTVLGRLPRPGTKATKGYEGLAYVPPRFSPSGKASLVAVHEGKPRRVSFFTLPGLVQTHDLKLSQALKDLLADLSDVTVDPVTGALVLLSDQSQRIVSVTVRGNGFEIVGMYDLPIGRKDKPEGIDFASKSTVYVVMDNAPQLLELEVLR